MVKKNACVFISGYGSNLNTLIKNSRDNSFPIKIRLVVCNNKNANGIKYGMEFVDKIKKGDPNSGAVTEPDKIISLKSK